MNYIALAETFGTVIIFIIFLFVVSRIKRWRKGVREDRRRAEEQKREVGRLRKQIEVRQGFYDALNTMCREIRDSHVWSETISRNLFRVIVKIQDEKILDVSIHAVDDERVEIQINQYSPHKSSSVYQTPEDTSVRFLIETLLELVRDSASRDLWKRPKLVK